MIVLNGGIRWRFCYCIDERNFGCICDCVVIVSVGRFCLVLIVEIVFY